MPALLNLPDELLTTLPPHLSPADTLALEASSIRIPKLIPKAATTAPDRLASAARTHRDAFAQACLEDAAGNLGPPNLLCSHCRALPGPHAVYSTPRFFSAAERTAPPFCRRCRGVVGTLRVCRHVALTRD
ncbi:hypothetical protein SLS56_004194 [Neofusicoccum ribis]|uniref:F-box domain-containing protein n=1 Tax=Neofusicoccum ribis TaxID=45134 RepID=A0ABR3SXL4_9PEZI